MRKITSAFPVVIMVGVFVFLFVFMCLPENPSEAQPMFTFSLHFLRTRFLYSAVLGGVLMMAFYHMTLYIFRRHETAYLYFTIWCLFSAIQFAFMPNGLNDIFTWIPAGEFLTRLRYVTLFLNHCSIIVVVIHVFSPHLFQTHKKVFITYLIVGLACTCFLPVNAPFFMPVYAFVMVSVSIFVTVVSFRLQSLKDNKWTWLFFISLVIFLTIGVINNLVFVNLLFMPGLLSGLFLILSQNVLLSKNYTDAFKLVEETNANLEQIVDGRTKDLKNTNNAMKELVGNISHDLKTPLAVMSVNLEELSNLSKTLSDENYTKCVSVAYQKNLDLQRLIQNLMEVSRIETAQSLLRLEWVSLSELLSQAQDKYDDYLKDKGIFLEISYTGNAEIYADPQRIWSVFDNIIYNAARYTTEDGIIAIHAAVSEKAVTITITDTGSGIAPEHLPHIFERFYKTDPSRATGGDSGLGLYIVKSIMEASSATVTAKSEPGKGTSLILRFVKK